MEDTLSQDAPWVLDCGGTQCVCVCVCLAVCLCNCIYGYNYIYFEYHVFIIGSNI